MIFNSQGDAKLRQYINGQTITPGDTAITLPKGAQLLGDVIIKAVDREAIYQEGYNEGYAAGYEEGYAAYAIEEEKKKTLLLLHGDSIKDNSIYNRAITNVGVTVSSAQSKFGGKSLYFNGSSNYLKVVDDAFNFGSGDFTVDWWEYCTGNSATRFTISVNGGCGGLAAGGGGNTNALYAGSTGTSWNIVNGATAFNKTANAWVHWAVVRKGNKMYSFRNGVLYWSADVSGSIYWNGAGLIVGSFLYDSNHYYGGYIDEFRVSNMARWTENFTPPTEAYII